jgi:hypothetical protein
MLAPLCNIRGDDMLVTSASPELQDAIKALIAKQMANELIGKADFSDREACRASLLATGFGRLSVDALVDNAIALARSAA